MKRHIHILFLAFVMAACTPAVETRHGTSLPNDVVREAQNLASLQAIDSLMWQQPDSALAVMLDFVASPEADSLDAFEEHYCQLLISELLYKNDCEQTNRAELLKAVDCFDSLCMTGDVAHNDSTRASRRHCGLDPQSPDLNDDIAFLTARTHYINGVGFYEQGDVVNACEEYLKALEVMEERFEEKELVGLKARFKGLLFNRLLTLFSDQYIPEPALICAQEALILFCNTPLSAYSVPSTLHWIGKQYAEMDKIDSAECYYSQALVLMPDTVNPYYRDLCSSIALENYLCHQQTANALQTLKRMAAEADDEDERLTRYFAIGDIYYREGLYDSALSYLQPVFDNKADLGIRLEIADHLSKIYGNLGEHEQEDAYIRFMAQYKDTDAENKSEASKLSTLFQDYENKKQQRQAEAEQKSAQKIAAKRTLAVAVSVALVVLAVLVWVLRKRNQKRLAATETASRQELEAMRRELEKQLQQQAEASKKLNEAEERLELQKSQTEALQLEMVRQKEEAAEKESDKGEAFLSEPVCLKIRDSVLLRSITTRDLPVEHKEVVLDEATSVLFCSVVNQHFEGLETRLRERYPRMKAQDMLLCYLHLLDLEEKQMAALLNLTYGAVKKKTARLQEYLKTDENLADFMKKLAGLQ